MVIESDWKNQGHYEEQHQDVFIISSYNQQKEEAHQQDHKLGRYDVGEDGSDKEPVFALEKGHAVRAVMPDMKRLVNDP